MPRIIKRIFPIILLPLILALPGRTEARTEFSHVLWDNLLQRHVQVLAEGKVTKVDYRAFQKDRGELNRYLEGLSKVSRSTFDSWPGDSQLAFLINAYNAWTVEFVLSSYPGLDSIKDLGSLFQSPWKKSFIPLLGKTRSLDNIEHTLIRGSGRYNDPRIHFAVNCASIGCPALQNSAYTGDKLDDQLERATRNFLADRTRNRLKKGTLQVSSIFTWYRKDFAAGWRGADSLAAFLALYSDSLSLTARQQEALRKDDLPLTFMEYNWQLNDLER